ncbi:hypothetical protein GGR58DRAFT_423488 [Xylaria digitata]|nr:hypothetical protein GGR58DRAFT_423488 [Xylaria digitata]
MMAGGIFMKQSLDGNICGMDMSLYGGLSEREESPTLGFSWAHQAGDAMYSPGQTVRDPARELWAGSTVGPYVSTNNEFNGDFRLDCDTAEPASSSTRGSAMEQPMDEATPSSAADFSSDQQGLGAEVYRRRTSSEPRGRTKSTSTSPTTPTDSTGALSLKHHREKNRVAARKCRQKAKLNSAGLQQRERELSQQNKLLRGHVGGLREEILDLKHEILRHSCCNSSVIQSYITNTARRHLE